MNLVGFQSFIFLSDDTLELPPERALYRGAVSDDKTMAVFFKIFWSSFLLCGMSFFLTLTSSCL